MPKWVKVIPSEMSKSKVEVLNGVEFNKILVQKFPQIKFHLMFFSRKIQELFKLIQFIFRAGKLL